MSLLFSCQDIEKSYGSQQLFKKLHISVFSGDRVGLIGPNGAGKSTLLKIVAGIEETDTGILSLKRDLRIGFVEQTTEFPSKTPLQILLEQLEANTALPDYEKERQAEVWLTKLGFIGDEPTADSLSGGWKKRLAIAQQLILQPDLLLLDEPTNHLDLEGVLWLETFLEREVPTCIIVSHDRHFLQSLCNRIVEINHMYPEGLLSIDGTFENFMEKKELFLKGQLQRERSFATKARRETDWLRQSPKARTTKAQSRVDRAEEILQEYDALKRRNATHRAKIQFEATERQTHKLLVGKNLKYMVDQRVLFNHLDITLSPKTRLGLIGPNGSGKTTLLRILAGEIEPVQGTLKLADGLKIVYFDQHRAQLPGETTLREALAPNGDFVNFRGKEIHVNGWCRRFLFSPSHLTMPIGRLSGGERARIAIAHLMLQPADLLLLDEPTNDLDIPTLEILEENLCDFPGAVALITHDRSLLENVCNLFLSLGDLERVDFYAAFSQWERLQKKKPCSQKRGSRARSKPKISLNALKKLEDQIHAHERRLSELTLLLDTERDHQKLQRLCDEIALLEKEIDALYHTWHSSQ